MKSNPRELQKSLLASPDELIHELVQAVSALATGISALEGDPEGNERGQRTIRVFRLTEMKLRDVVERLRNEANAKDAEIEAPSFVSSNPGPEQGQHELRGAP